MQSNDTGLWRKLQRWSVAAFIVAGIVRLINLSISQLNLSTELAVPSWALSWTLTVAYVAVIVALLGLYPRLVDRSPWLSRVGIVTIALAAVGQLGIIGVELLLGGEAPPGPLKMLPLLVLVFIPLSLLLFGVASLRTGAFSGAIGVLLLVAAGSMLGSVAGVFALDNLQVLRIGTGLYSIALVVIGYLLHTSPVQTERAEPSMDPSKG